MSKSHFPTYRYTLTRPVYLVGFMGAGKTTLGRFLGKMYGLPHIDSDAYIAEHQGRSIASIFQTDGEQTFRDIESEYLEFFAHLDPPTIVSCGGGVVVRSSSIDLMHRTGYVVWLEETAADAQRRISNVASRPLFHPSAQASGRKSLENEPPKGEQKSPERLLAERLPMYERAADAHVSTARRASFEVAKEVGRLLMNADVLKSRKLM